MKGNFYIIILKIILIFINTFKIRHFFEDLAEYAEYCANKGKIVIISALDSTYERKV
jgi:hypothetical protein